MTTPVSVVFSEKARRSERLILRRLDAIGEAETGRRVGVDGSTINKWKNERRTNDFTHLQQIVMLLDALGLKVIDADAECYDKKTISAVLTIAQTGMASMSLEAMLSMEAA